MPDRNLLPLATDHAEACQTVLGLAHGVEAPPVGDTRAERGDNSGWIAAIDDDQLAREIAAIEQASVALRRGEPGLKSWAEPPASVHSPQPLWLIIGTLWVSTALVTLSAVFALYALTS